MTLNKINWLPQAASRANLHLTPPPKSFAVAGSAESASAAVPNQSFEVNSTSIVETSLPTTPDVSIPSSPTQPVPESQSVDTVYFDCFDLKIVYERGRTGFEASKNFPIEVWLV